MRLGYIYCSALEQNEARQMQLLKGHRAELIYIDRATGSKYDTRSDRDYMLSSARVGDVIIVESIDKLANSSHDFTSILSLLAKKKVAFISIKECIDTNTPAGRLVLNTALCLAEMDQKCSCLAHDQVQQTTAPAATSQEKKFASGRKPIEFDQARFKSVCKRWRTGEITATAAMQEVGLKPNTFYRRVKELGI